MFVVASLGMTEMGEPLGHGDPLASAAAAAALARLRPDEGMAAAKLACGGGDAARRPDHDREAEQDDKPAGDQ
jgi:hypothetical protein